VKTIFLLILAMMTMSLALPYDASAQRSSGVSQSMGLEIDVQVRTSDGQAAPVGIHVVLELAEGGPVDDCQTQPGGKCRFIPPTTGSYIVRVKEPDYKQAFARVDLISTPKGYASLTLTPIPGAAPAKPPKDAAGPSVSAADLAVPDNARKEFDAAQKALEAKDMDGGIAHLKKAIELYPNFPQAHATMGAAYLEQKKFKEAQEALEKATQLDPKAAGAYIELGATLNQLKDYPGAVAALTKGLGLNPDVPAGDYELAKAYMAQQQWQNAEPYLRKTLAAQPDMAGAHVMLGNVLLKKGDGPGALAEFQTYLKLDPNGPMAAGVRDVIPKIETAIAKQQHK
jgi:tetratricopeptide (TPR) repeat protein